MLIYILKPRYFFYTTTYMDNTQYLDHGVFAERISRVATGTMTEDEFRIDFPEITCVDHGADHKIERFMFRDRFVYQVTIDPKGNALINKIAHFGDSESPIEERDRLIANKNELEARLTEYLVPGVVLINPKTFEPFEDNEEENIERDEYLDGIRERIIAIDTQLSTLKHVI